MRTAQQTLDATYLEMRWRTLSLAADLDRIQRAPGGEQAMRDPRMQNLRKCLEILLNAGENRAAQVQMILSDTSPPPRRT
ncbi:MAG: hypothetical protein NZ561_06485 [Phycisphaerae bacterium]|nr:hypothetical protein [Phycisphaerae bacterium]MDW8261131.1 hypothetical protein [Phycisphaerales bacterium]